MKQNDTKYYGMQDIRDAITKGNLDIEKASKYMNDPSIQSLIHKFINLMDTGFIALDPSLADCISFFVDVAYYIYTYSDLPTGLTDTEYDKFWDILITNGMEEYSSLRDLDKGEKDFHKYPLLRGTLSKVHFLDEPNSKNAKSRRSLDKWISKIENIIKDKTGKEVNLRDEDVYIFPKWDGVSVIFEFDEQGWLIKALTRGYTKLNSAENITHHFIGFERSIDDKIPYGLKTEVMVKEEIVEEYNMTYKKDFKQSRSIVSGILNSLRPDERNQHLVIMQLRYMTDDDKIEKLCPEVFKHPFVQCKLGDYTTIENFSQTHRVTEGLRCDGVVIHIINPELQNILGRDNDRNNFEVAYKFTEEAAYSRVKDIEFQVGLLGRVTPVVKIEPVKMKGNTIKSASLSNVDRFEELQLAKGDDVKILYDIIPYITKDNKCKKNKKGNKPIKLKAVCPSCGAPLERKGSFLFCNNLDCDCRVKGKILNFLIKMGIQGISYSTVDWLYKKGILMSIEDIYSLHKYKNVIVDNFNSGFSDLISMGIPDNKFGAITFDNWIREINRKRTIPDYTLLGALGIEGVGEKNFEKVFEHFEIEDLFEIASKDSWRLLDDVKGIGRTKAKSIVNGILMNKDLIKFLYKELDVTHINPDDVKFVVCFTKIRDLRLEDDIVSLGGKVTDTINSKVNYLVVPDKEVESTKTKYANDHNIPIITIEEMIDIIEKYKSKEGTR